MYVVRRPGIERRKCSTGDRDDDRVVVCRAEGDRHGLSGNRAAGRVNRRSPWRSSPSSPLWSSPASPATRPASARLAIWPPAARMRPAGAARPLGMPAMSPTCAWPGRSSKTIMPAARWSCSIGIVPAPARPTCAGSPGITCGGRPTSRTARSPASSARSIPWSSRRAGTCCPPRARMDSSGSGRLAHGSCSAPSRRQDRGQRRHVLAGWHATGDRRRRGDVQALGCRPRADASFSGQPTAATRSSSGSRRTAGRCSRAGGRMASSSSGPRRGVEGDRAVHATDFEGAVVSPDGTFVATTGSGMIRLWDLARLSLVAEGWRGHDPVQGAVFSRDGQTPGGRQRGDEAGAGARCPEPANPP